MIVSKDLLPGAEVRKILMTWYSKVVSCFNEGVFGGLFCSFDEACRSWKFMASMSFLMRMAVPPPLIFLLLARGVCIGLLRRWYLSNLMVVFEDNCVSWRSTRSGSLTCRYQWRRSMLA